MKKILLSAAITLCCIPTLVLANENDTYYTTTNGYELSQKQYENLLTAFTEEEINNLTDVLLDVFKDDKLTVTTESKYFKTEYKYDNKGNIINSNEKEISETEWINNQIVAHTVITKNYDQRKLTMKAVANESDKIFDVNLENEWTSIPKVKSYDVIGLRPTKDVALINETVYAIQYYNNEKIDYNVFGGSNAKVDKEYSLGKFEYLLRGIGVSMNLVDAATYGLKNQLHIAVKVPIVDQNQDILNIVGAYQHATSDVSLSDSKSYKFSTLGLGGVFDYSNTSIRNKYESYDGIYMHAVAGLI